jgi:hypothetical protein
MVGTWVRILIEYSTKGKDADGAEAPDEAPASND